MYNPPTGLLFSPVAYLDKVKSDSGPVLKLFLANIYFDGEIEFDSMINPPRNREAGYPRAGRDVADPKARKVIEELVNKWIIQ